MGCPWRRLRVADNPCACDLQPRPQCSVATISGWQPCRTVVVLLQNPWLLTTVELFEYSPPSTAASCRQLFAPQRVVPGTWDTYVMLQADAASTRDQAAPHGRASGCTLTSTCQGPARHLQLSPRRHHPLAGQRQPHARRPRGLVASVRRLPRTHHRLRQCCQVQHG